MMRTKLSLALMVSLLFCTLATLELPELIHLTDDTSNDYSLVIFSENTVRVVRNETWRLQTQRGATANSSQPLTRRVSPCRLARSSGDVLHLLSTLRT
jgi:hypothetical protein